MVTNLETSEICIIFKWATKLNACFSRDSFNDGFMHFKAKKILENHLPITILCGLFLEWLPNMKRELSAFEAKNS